MNEWIVGAVRRFGSFWPFATPWRYAIIVSVVTSLVLYPMGPFMYVNLVTSMDDLFSNQPLANITTLGSYSWTSNNVYASLFAYSSIRFLLTVLDVTLPVPIGIVFPSFAIGAGFGRLCGELLLLAFPTANILPAAYAIVGAAAMSAGVTRTVSSAVIVMEFTGNTVLMLPILLAVVVAIGVGGYLSVGFFDSILVMKRLPYLPMLLSDRMLAYTAQDIMASNVLYALRRMPYSRLAQLLRSVPQHRSYPILDSDTNRILLGAIDRQALEHAFHDYCVKHRYATAYPTSAEDAHLFNVADGRPVESALQRFLMLTTQVAVAPISMSLQSSASTDSRSNHQFSVAPVVDAQRSPNRPDSASTPRAEDEAAVQTAEGEAVQQYDLTRLRARRGQGDARPAGRSSEAEQGGAITARSAGSGSSDNDATNGGPPPTDATQLTTGQSPRDTTLAATRLSALFVPPQAAPAGREASPRVRFSDTDEHVDDRARSHTTGLRGQLSTGLQHLRQAATRIGQTTRDMFHRSSSEAITDGNRACTFPDGRCTCYRYVTQAEMRAMAGDHIVLIGGDSSLEGDLDLSPFTLVEFMPLAEVHFLFTMLRLHRAYVTRFGTLVGLISRTDLVRFLLQH